uniref:Uncharacterized protein n=1 Tax=Dunaliella tertiolecta TaxID=3047 RepID=A0A7S3QTD8_DUNTE
MVEKRQRLLEAVRGRPQMDHPPSLQQGGQEQEQDLCEAEAEAAAVPSDLEAAIAFLRDEMRVTCPQLPPLVCHTQLCSMLADKTSIERGLDDCRRRNVLRVFKLATGADEHGILLMHEPR